MKKFLLGLAVVVGLASVSVASAADVAGYITGSHADGKSALAAGKAAITPTDIVISNATPYYIYFTVAGSGKENGVRPGDWGYVKHSSAADDIHLKIKDEFYNVFWDHTVCSRAVIVVSRNSESGVKVNSEYCH